MKNRIVSVIFGGLLVIAICLVVSGCSEIVRENTTYRITSGNNVIITNEYISCNTESAQSRIMVSCYDGDPSTQVPNFSIIADKFEILPEDK